MTLGDTINNLLNEVLDLHGNEDAGDFENQLYDFQQQRITIKSKVKARLQPVVTLASEAVSPSASPSWMETFMKSQQEQKCQEQESQAAQLQKFQEQNTAMMQKLREAVQHLAGSSQVRRSNVNETDETTSTSRLPSGSLKSSLKTPKIELPEFNGSIENWVHYKDMFVSLVHNNEALDDIRNFHYLRTLVNYHREA